MSDRYDIYRDAKGWYSVYRNDRFLKVTMTKWGARFEIKQDRQWRKDHGGDELVLVEGDG